MNQLPAGVHIEADGQGNPVPGQLYFAGQFAAVGLQAGDIQTDGNGVPWAYPRYRLAYAPNIQADQANVLWNNQAAGAGGASTAMQTFGQWGRGAIYATASAATNLTAQGSFDGVTWYDLTQDNAGTLWTLALVAGHLAAARDLPGHVPPYIRLLTSAAVTLTAGVVLTGI